MATTSPPSLPEDVFFEIVTLGMPDVPSLRAVSCFHNRQPNDVSAMVALSPTESLWDPFSSPAHSSMCRISLGMAKEIEDESWGLCSGKVTVQLAILLLGVGDLGSQKG